MKIVFAWLVILFCIKTNSFAQVKDQKVPKIAVFSPLFLDSVFNEKGYKYGKLIPSFAVQGVEYYFGAQAAIDSLTKENNPVEFFVFDSKYNEKNISSLIANGDLNNMDMLIGSVVGADVKTLAEFALKKNIPFISATYPNDVGIINNPNFLIINSTLKSNCKALYELVQNKFSEQKIVVFSKTGKQEERITNYFKEFEKNNTKGSLAISYVNFGDSVTADNISKNLDSTVLSTYIVASTDVAFAKTIAQTIVKNKLQEQSNLMGMPTWDDATEFNKKDYDGIHFYYATPMIKPSHPIAIKLANQFKAKYGTTPGDNMYRGYETIYKFTKLLMKHHSNLLSNFNDKEFTNLTNYDIQPVMLNAANMTLDYFENKKVCLVKKFNSLSTPILQ